MGDDDVDEQKKESVLFVELKAVHSKLLLVETEIVDQFMKNRK